MTTAAGANATHRVRVLGVRREVHVSGPRGHRIAAVARLQQGHICRAQLAQLGVTRRMIDAMVADGTLHRVHRGVYAVGHLGPMALGREAAALLAVPRAVALCRQSAAAVWGIKAVTAPPNAPVHVLVAGVSGSRRTTVQVHRTRLLRPRDIRIRDGLPVTSPAWTALDLADTIAGYPLEAIIDELLTRKLLREADLVELLRRCPGRGGTGELRALIDRESAPALTRSEGERRMLALIRSARLPAPRTNVRMHGFEVDFYWPEHGLVVELDGRPFHSRHRAFERDHRKDQLLRAAGLQPLRITGGQVKHEALVVVALIAHALATADR